MDVPQQRNKFYVALGEQLAAFAEWTFRNRQPQSDGAALSEHKQSAAAQWAKLGRKVLSEQVLGEAPSFPQALGYLWQWFCEHSGGLVHNGASPTNVTWVGLLAWSQLMRIELAPWEVLTLVKLGSLSAKIDNDEIMKRIKSKSR